MKWIERAESFFAKTPTPPTPKTPERGVMGVLGVPTLSFSEKSHVVLGVLGVPPPGISEKTHFVDSCRYCAHHRRPGIGNRYCGGRADLPLAYGRGHPLRHLPDDLGDSCRVFALAESYR